MSVKVNFQVHGLKELQKALLQLPKELVSNNGGPVRTALMAATLPVMKQAQNTVPDRDKVENSGRLARSIRRRRMTKFKRKGMEGVQVYIRKGKKGDDPSGAFYAPFVEFGARGKTGTRWFTKSLEDNRKLALEIFRTRLAGSIARIAKKIGAENLREVGAKVKKLGGSGITEL